MTISMLDPRYELNTPPNPQLQGNNNKRARLNIKDPSAIGTAGLLGDSRVAATTTHQQKKNLATLNPLKIPNQSRKKIPSKLFGSSLMSSLSPSAMNSGPMSVRRSQEIDNLFVMYPDLLQNNN